MKLRSYITPKTVIAFLFLIWIGTHLYLWQRFGLFYHDDSHRYYTYAMGIVNEGYFPFNHNFWYLGYALFLSPFVYFSLPSGAILFGQVVLSGIAAIALGKATYQLSGKVWAGIIASALFILWFRIQWFNYYILTESVFVNLNILFFYALLQYRQLSFKYLLLLPLLAFTCLIRPNGFFTLLAFLLYLSALIYEQYPKIFWKALPILTILVIFAFAWLNQMLDNFLIIRAFEKGEIICVSAQNTLTPSSSLQLPPMKSSPLYKLIYFVIFNFSYFIELAFWRLMYFFGSVRSGYSTLHNALIVVVQYPCYLFALFAIFRNRFFFPAKVYLVSFILLYALLAVFTGANWNGRFIAPVLPFVFMLAGIGVSQIGETYFKKIIQ